MAQHDKRTPHDAVGLLCPTCRAPISKLKHDTKLKTWTCPRRRCDHVETDTEVHLFVSAMRARITSLNRGLLRANGGASDAFRAVLEYYERWVVAIEGAA